MKKDNDDFIQIGKHQAQVLSLVLEGNSFEEIALKLKLPVRSVEFFIRLLMGKLKKFIE